jgi:hydroxybutyrate-dimer hydrolase
MLFFSCDGSVAEKEWKGSVSLRRIWLVAGTALCACAAGRAGAGEFNELPKFIRGAPVTTHYDGVTNDLLTAGLGASGLQSSTQPTVSSPPTDEELRRLAIYTNYRALVDPTTGGGYGVLYGPSVDANGHPTGGQGLIAGDETLAYAAERDDSAPITLMVQVPDSYNPAQGCIVTGPSSASRDIYGAIASAGDWGLKHGCAVAYTDKGTGIGFDDLQNGLVDTLRGDVATIAAAGANAQFVAPLSPEERAQYNAAFPNRFAFKHAFSRQNPERDWGRDVLQSIRFAFYVLNKKFPVADISKRNTIVIASSISNGGGASLRAVEQDHEGLIDGAAVSEPNVNPKNFRPFTIAQAGSPPFTAQPTELSDYVTFQNIYEGCAVVSLPAPFNFAPSAARCAALHADGLLASATLADQAAEAQQKLNAFGFLPEQNFTEGVLWFAYVPQAIVVTYANAYGRFRPTDNLCGISFAATDPTSHAVVPLASASEAVLFGSSNGIPPIPTPGGVNLVNLVNNGAGTEDRASTPDQDLAAALCFRGLATGVDPVTGQTVAPADNSAHVRNGNRQVLATGDLHGVPAIIVEGRSDGILPPNFVDRAYVGLNAQTEGGKSQLRYYEVTNANHLDEILALHGFDTTLVPLIKYYIEAMDLMYAHLRSGAALPPSQVVHTIPRGGAPGAAPPITLANVPPIQSNPGANAIVYSRFVLRIPQ